MPPRNYTLTICFQLSLLNTQLANAMSSYLTEHTTHILVYISGIKVYNIVSETIQI